jgi:predicted nucleic acid-binding protein
MSLKIFVDTDVIISSLISKTGAAHLLLNYVEKLDLFVSNISAKEAGIVTKRLSLSQSILERMCEERFSTVTLEETIDQLQKKFSRYVLDIDDAHIVAGAKKAQVQFLISYNIKHFKVDALKEDLGIILTTPANMLQYLRSVCRVSEKS